MKPEPKVVALGDDKYEVSCFSWSLPQIIYVVKFFGNEAAVIERRALPTAENGRDFDRHAIGAAQTALMLNTVQKEAVPVTEPSKDEITTFVTYFYKWCRYTDIIGTNYLAHNLRGRMRDYLATDSARALHLRNRETDNVFVLKLLDEAENKIRHDWAESAAISRKRARKRDMLNSLKRDQYGFNF